MDRPHQEVANVQSPNQIGARKYCGELASGYDAKREQSDKWKAEDRIVRRFLSVFPRGSTVVDCPVGTGRFIPLYEDMGFHVYGMDLSDDMLKEAAKKVKGDNIWLRTGDARKLDIPDQSVDVALCIRLFRWLSLEEVGQVLRELQRVARTAIIFNARVCSHPYERPLWFLLSHLSPEWKVVAVDAIEPNFLMFMLGRQ